MIMMHKKKFYLFANWKMYLDLKNSVMLAKNLCKDKKKFGGKLEMAIFPSSFSFLSVKEALKNTGLQIGSQNAHWEDKGGCTGEVSMYDYKKAGAKYVLVGHSERRHLFHETNQEVRNKIETSVCAGIIPVLCVGETQKERESTKEKEAVSIQLESALNNRNGCVIKKIVVAYEPVWAIGTGKNCDPEEAERMLEFIGEIVAKLLPTAEIILLYGGSVKGENVASFLSKQHINGVLVGGASAKLDSWLKIAQNVVV